MEKLKFKINKVGTLKYPRLESLSILRKELNSFDYKYNMNDVKRLLDSILNNIFEEYFDLKIRICLDSIFHDTEYTVYNQEEELNFPNNWISPKC